MEEGAGWGGRAGVKGWSVPKAPIAPGSIASFNDSRPLPVANDPTQVLYEIMRPYAQAMSSPIPFPKSMPKRLILKTEKGKVRLCWGNEALSL